MPSSLLCLRVKSSLYRKRYSLRIKSGHFLDHEALSIETVAFFFFSSLKAIMHAQMRNVSVLRKLNVDGFFFPVDLDHLRSS